MDTDTHTAAQAATTQQQQEPERSATQAPAQQWQAAAGDGGSSDGAHAHAQVPQSLLPKFAAQADHEPLHGGMRLNLLGVQGPLRQHQMQRAEEEHARWQKVTSTLASLTK